ncbi:MAG: hydantoinase/carbamoylase family amidase [Paracoccaceae bacterium]
MNALDRARRLFDELARISSDPPGVTRASFGPVENAAHDMIRREAEDIGLEHRTDDVGNLYVTLPGTDRNAPALMTGSHLDSVPHGGNFDGAAGVLAGLVMLETLANGPMPPFDITLMAIRAEEMIWFPEHYLGSRAAFGLLPRDTPDRVCRADTGRTLADHMTEAGFDPQAIRNSVPQLNPANIRAFVEVHIEQGPVLTECGCPIGVVTAIRGNIRHRFVHIRGETTHAGGVPRKSRRDAVLAGAELVGALERFWRAAEDAGDDMVLTVGEFFTNPTTHGITKVPGDVSMTLDMRSEDDRVIDRFELFLRAAAERISSGRSVQIDLGPQTRASPARMSVNLRDELGAAAEKIGFEFKSMSSGGGHDCATFASLGVPSGMIFIQNENGSHNPDEHMAFDHFARASDTLSAWAKRRALLVDT